MIPFIPLQEKKLAILSRGGFLIENAFTHVFGKFSRVPCLILKKEVTEEQFENMKKTISHFAQNATQYKYDYLNLLFAKTPLTFPHHNRYFCSGFVAYVLNQAGIKTPSNIQKIRPYEFTSMPHIEKIYEGDLKEWCTQKGTVKTKN